MSRHYLLLLLTVITSVLTGSSGGFEVARAQADVFLGAIACNPRGQQIDFALVRSSVGGEPAVAALPNASLDILHTHLAVSCQAVFEDARAETNPFALPAGRVTFTVTGPGLIVESGSQIYNVACGDQGTPASCAGAVVAGQPLDAVMTATEDLTVHVALLPGVSAAAVPPAPAPLVVTATYQPNDASDAALVSTAIDLVPPTYRLSLSADRAFITSATTGPTLVAAHLWREVPDACTPIAGGPFLVCQQRRLEPGAAGVEPGLVVFTTSLGEFVNLEQRIEVPCINQPTPTPAPGEDGVYPLECTGVSARLTPFGISGDALVTATFTGVLTGATASGQIPLTITPAPASFSLRGGCTVLPVPASVPADSPAQIVVDSVTPSRAVYAVWRRNVQNGEWEAIYLRGGEGPLDAALVNPGDRVAICVDAPATYPLS